MENEKSRLSSLTRHELSTDTRLSNEYVRLCWLHLEVIRSIDYFANICQESPAQNRCSAADDPLPLLDHVDGSTKNRADVPKLFQQPSGETYFPAALNDLLFFFDLPMRAQ